jgi:hypothetical protein
MTHGIRRPDVALNLNDARRILLEPTTEDAQSVSFSKKHRKQM